MAVVIPHLEGFSPKVLEKLVKVFAGRHSDLPICFILGISTQVEVLHQSLSKATISALNTTVFQLRQAQESLNQIVKRVGLVILIIDPLRVKVGTETWRQTF
jgi:origin recognition complex subunit 3